MGQIAVGNVKDYGQDPAGWPVGAVYIGRQVGAIPPSPLANPYRLTPSTARDAVIEDYRAWLKGRILGKDTSLAARRTVNELARLAVDPPSMVLCWCAPEACHGHVVSNCLDWWRGNLRHVAVVGARPHKWADPTLAEHVVRDVVMALPSNVVVVSGHAEGVDTWAEDYRYAMAGLVYSLPVSAAEWRADRYGAGKKRNTRIVAASQAVIAIYNGKDGGTHDTVKKAKAAGKTVVTITPTPGMLETPSWLPEVRAMLATLPPLQETHPYAHV